MQRKPLLDPGRPAGGRDGPLSHQEREQIPAFFQTPVRGAAGQRFLERGVRLRGQAVGQFGQRHPLPEGSFGRHFATDPLRVKRNGFGVGSVRRLRRGPCFVGGRRLDVVRGRRRFRGVALLVPPLPAALPKLVRFAVTAHRFGIGGQLGAGPAHVTSPRLARSWPPPRRCRCRSTDLPPSSEPLRSAASAARRPAGYQAPGSRIA